MPQTTNPYAIKLRDARQEMAYAKAHLGHAVRSFILMPTQANFGNLRQEMDLLTETRQIATSVAYRSMKQLGYPMTKRLAVLHKMTDLGS